MNSADDVTVAKFEIGSCIRLSTRGFSHIRLGWATRIDLNHLVSAEHDPTAMEHSIRKFGIGGLFCYVGFCSNDKIDSYRAYATDSKRSVVLKFPGRTIVVNPDRPGEFVARIEGMNRENGKSNHENR